MIKKTTTLQAQPAPAAAPGTSAPGRGSVTSSDLGIGIEIDWKGCGMWSLVGSRAQLEAEGVIPAGTEWPDGLRNLHWTDGRLEYTLFRVRPQGFKGPMRAWTEGDWWRLRCRVKDGPDYAARCIRAKRRELAEEIYRHSEEGDRAWHIQRARAQSAREDKAFQAFREAILPPAKTLGRRPARNSPEGA